MGSDGSHPDSLTQGDRSGLHKEPWTVWRAGQGDEDQFCQSRTGGQMSLPNRELPSFVSKRDMRSRLLFWGDCLKQSLSLKNHYQIFATDKGASLFFSFKIFLSILFEKLLHGFSLKFYSHTVALLNRYCFY